MLPASLSALTACQQFILCKLVPDAASGKIDKIPADYRSGQTHINAHDPQFHTDSWTVDTMPAIWGADYVAAFVLRDDDPFFCLDIDGALLPDNTWHPEALALVGRFPGAAVEVSTSGRGLHIWGAYTGVMPDHACRGKTTDVRTELYTTKRFIALGQPNATGNAGADCTLALASVIAELFPAGASVPMTADEWIDAAAPEWHGPDDDAELIRRMLASKPSAAASFGNRPTPGDLWTRNLPILSAAYPTTTTGEPYDGSQADAALASHLAWWTGKNPVRMQRLMRESALCRDKYDRDDYLPRTIRAAISVCDSVMQDKRIVIDKPKKDKAYKPTAKIIEGATYAGTTDQIAIFEGCCYVSSIDQILLPDGRTVDAARFNKEERYHKYTYTLDREGEKVAKNAWHAYTESKAVTFPRAETMCFRPDIEPGMIRVVNGFRVVNAFYQPEVERIKGDATPFTKHLRKILPNDKDREILTCYLAAMAQFPGSKFQWAPLVQGAEGNGKSFLKTAMAYCVGGDSKWHQVNASDIGGNGGKFTGWMRNKLMICIEEIKTGHRTELLEIMKPWITESSIEIQGKGADQVTGDNRANFLLFTNHKDAITKTTRDRRYCILYTAQQEHDHIARDGMDGDYFPDLYNWLRKDGYAIIADYLMSYPIPAELNPALDRGGLCQRAPDTSSTVEALSLSQGRIEQEIGEAIQSGRNGFSGGWVSSVALDELLRERRADGSVPRNKRGEVMASLGYVTHPGLPGGRTTVLVNGVRPVLYVRKDSIQAGLTGGAAIVRAFESTQITVFRELAA